MKRDCVISLFDHSGIAVAPWLDAGYDCWIVDIKHKGVIRRWPKRGKLHVVQYDLSKAWPLPVAKERIAMMCAFPPCDHLSVSGARWFKGKGLRALAHSIELFATAAEMCEDSGAPYFIENPVSAISSHWRKPDYSCSPYHFTALSKEDNYNKKTCLWVGNGFNMPPISEGERWVNLFDDDLRAEGLGPPDDRIHRMGPSDERPSLRSMTPLGFARAIFKANCGAVHSAKDEGKRAR